VGLHWLQLLILDDFHVDPAAYSLWHITSSLYRHVRANSSKQVIQQARSVKRPLRIAPGAILALFCNLRKLSLIVGAQSVGSDVEPRANSAWIGNLFCVWTAP
jgi:hypothetical protein